MPGQCVTVAGAMYKGCRSNVLTCENKVNSFSVQLKVELGLQVREEFDKKFEFAAYPFAEWCSQRSKEQKLRILPNF